MRRGLETWNRAVMSDLGYVLGSEVRPWCCMYVLYKANVLAHSLIKNWALKMLCACKKIRQGLHFGLTLSVMWWSHAMFNSVDRTAMSFVMYPGDSFWLDWRCPTYQRSQRVY